MTVSHLIAWSAVESRPLASAQLPAARTATTVVEQTELLRHGAYRSADWSIGRYQLKNRISAVRLPTVSGNRKSSAAENNHGVRWKRACAEKNRSAATDH